MLTVYIPVYTIKCTYSYILYLFPVTLKPIIFPLSLREIAVEVKKLAGNVQKAVLGSKLFNHAGAGLATIF